MINIRGNEVEMFTDKVFLITGAGSGIGRETAVAFSRRNAKVVVADISGQEGENTSGIIRGEGGEVRFYRVDVTNASEVEGLIQVSTYGYQPGLRCSVNARCGREGDYPSPMEKVKKPKRVLVIGGGPGGMEAARVSALRGHDVTLMEKSDELGGQLLYADKAPSKHNIGLLSKYLSRQVRNLEIKIELGKEATPEIVAGYDPDAVIIATGAEPLTPSIEGVDKPNVIQALDVLSGGTVGQRVVVVGGDMVGCETAEILADQGKNVTICEMTRELLTRMAVQLRRPVIARMKEKGIQYNLGAKVRKVLDEGVSFVDGDGEEGFIEAETVVLACGSQPVNDLVARLEGQVPEIHCVGDAKEPRQIVYAVHEAFDAAYKL
jgi:NADPH-dependent 2,4-dienoyl-CoA reductase/sulfur reductase-like enzyme